MLPVLKGKFFQHPKLKQSLLGPSALEKAKEEERIKRLEAAQKKANEVEPDPLASEPEVSYVSCNQGVVVIGTCMGHHGVLSPRMTEDDQSLPG